jgi:hypothetical protein
MFIAQSAKHISSSVRSGMFRIIHISLLTELDLLLIKLRL